MPKRYASRTPYLEEWNLLPSYLDWHYIRIRIGKIIFPAAMALFSRLNEKLTMEPRPNKSIGEVMSSDPAIRLPQISETIELLNGQKIEVMLVGRGLHLPSSAIIAGGGDTFKGGAVAIKQKREGMIQHTESGVKVSIRESHVVYLAWVDLCFPTCY